MATELTIPLDMASWATFVSALSILGGGILAYLRLLSTVKTGQSEMELRFAEQRLNERKQILSDFQEWYAIAQRSFQEVRLLQLQLQALELHIQRLEAIMRESGLIVPNRPQMARTGSGDGHAN